MFKRLTEQLQKFIQYFENEESAPLFEDEWTVEAWEQYNALESIYKEKASTAIEIFKMVGTKYKNLNTLKNGLYELKPGKVRIYFKYHPTRRKIIVVGFVCLKKSQKADPKTIDQAHNNIDNYIKGEQNGDNQ